MQLPKGFTVVESLVALTLIGVALAAWIGTATLAISVASEAEQSTGAAYRAKNRAERLAASPCAAVVAGATATESWSVRHYPNGFRLIEVEAPFGARRRVAIAKYAVFVEC